MKDESKVYNIAVIGAGAAGSMAAIRAGQLSGDVVLLERNDSIGRKIMLTGNGRCNITNAGPIDLFISKFNPGGEFLRTAFFVFSNDDLMDLLRSKGLGIKIESDGKVFPVTDKARSIVSFIEKALEECGVELKYGMRIVGIKPDKDYFTITSEKRGIVNARKVVLATGGVSYSVTGSSGDGFSIAGSMGHHIVPLRPALVPLTAKEPWVAELKGLALKDVSIALLCGGRTLSSGVGEMIFTHFGVSGPLVLDMSGEAVAALSKNKEIVMAIDLRPGFNKEQLEARLINKFTVKSSVQIKNLLQDLLPKRMVPVFLSILGISYDERANQITKLKRRAIVDLLKAFTVTITGSLPIEDAMVTAGGVSKKEIDPRTMASKIVPGLYFAGEMIEGAAPSGGYNLQQAFSTGYLAGEDAAKK